MQLTLQVSTVEKDPCACLKWAEVYTTEGMACNPGIGGLAGPEFCNFIQHLNSSVCLQQQFMPPKIVDSFCYVSKECPISKTLEGENVNAKLCETGKDVILTELPVTETKELARQNGCDQGCMAGYASVYRSELSRDVSPEEIAQIKASGVPTFIWSMKDHGADRLQIRDNQTWVHKPNPAGYWEVSCREGCD